MRCFFLSYLQVQLPSHVAHQVRRRFHGFDEQHGDSSNLWSGTTGNTCLDHPIFLSHLGYVFPIVMAEVRGVCAHCPRLGIRIYSLQLLREDAPLRWYRSRGCHLDGR